MLGTPNYATITEITLEGIAKMFSVGEDSEGLPIITQLGIDKCMEYLEKNGIEEWKLCCANGICFMSWIEKGHLNAVDYEYVS